MQLRGVSQDGSCRSWLAMSRTVDLIHRAKRTCLRGYQRGGWLVPWCGAWLGAGHGCGSFSGVGVSWEEVQGCPAPSLELLFSLLLGGCRFPHALECWDPSHTLLPLLPTPAAPSPSPDQPPPPDFKRGHSSGLASCRVHQAVPCTPMASSVADSLRTSRYHASPNRAAWGRTFLGCEVVGMAACPRPGIAGLSSMWTR